MMKSGMAQVVLGALSIILTLSVEWVTVNRVQAETEVKIEQLTNRADKEDKYEAFLQSQVDSNKERIVVTETAMSYLKENSIEMNSNIKDLIVELKELNTKIAVLAVKRGDAHG
jgi:septal ring factor EnvC (AmiA/AmiB activator)